MVLFAPKQGGGGGGILLRTTPGVACVLLGVVTEEFGCGEEGTECMPDCRSSWPNSSACFMMPCARLHL